MQIRFGYTSANNTTFHVMIMEKHVAFYLWFRSQNHKSWMITISLTAHGFQTELKKEPTKNPTARALCIF